MIEWAGMEIKEKMNAMFRHIYIDIYHANRVVVAFQEFEADKSQLALLFISKASMDSLWIIFAVHRVRLIHYNIK